MNAFIVYLARFHCHAKVGARPEAGAIDLFLHPGVSEAGMGHKHPADVDRFPSKPKEQALQIDIDYNFGLGVEDELLQEGFHRQIAASLGGSFQRSWNGAVS